MPASLLVSGIAGHAAVNDLAHQKKLKRSIMI
jgi:hypothetical protein